MDTGPKTGLKLCLNSPSVNLNVIVFLIFFLCCLSVRKSEICVFEPCEPVHLSAEPLASFGHAAMTLRAAGELEKLQRGTTSGRPALRMREQTRFSAFQRSNGGGALYGSVGHCLSFLCLIGMGGVTEGQRRLHKLILESDGKILASGFVHFSQQADFSLHVRIT